MYVAGILFVVTLIVYMFYFERLLLRNLYGKRSDARHIVYVGIHHSLSLFRVNV